MTTLTRRSLLRNSVGLAAVGALPSPYTANAAATTVVTWWNQGYLPEEDVSFRALVADYQKASSNKIDYSLIPNAPLTQKEISAVQSGGVPDLMEVADIRFTPLNAWDAFLDFFMQVQDKLREQGMRNVYAYGYQLAGNGGDPIVTFNQFMIAYGGKDFITQDGKLHTDDPKVREAAVKGLVKLTTPCKDGYVPPGVVSWNDADDNNAFHSKLMVMDFDGSISTELALYNNKEEYDATVTHGLPLGNDGGEGASPSRWVWPDDPERGEKRRGGQKVYQIHARAEGAERVSEGRAWPFRDPDARDGQERPVLAQGGSASDRPHRADALRSDLADLRGLQSSNRGSRCRACVQRR